MNTARRRSGPLALVSISMLALCSRVEAGHSPPVAASHSSSAPIPPVLHAQMLERRPRDGTRQQTAPAPGAPVPRAPSDSIVEPPPEQKLDEVNEKCDAYARRAEEQFHIMESREQCRVPSDARWNAERRQHYRWCLRANDASLDAEERARDTHLRNCGAQARTD